jgi:hypothetical protein
MLIALPLDHVVLGLAEVSVLRSEQRLELKKFSVLPFENFRRVLEPGRNGSGMKQSAHSHTAKALRPKLVQTVERKKDRHGRFQIVDLRLMVLRVIRT